MILGILQTGHVPDQVAARDGTYTDLFARLFAHRGFTLRTYSVVDMEFPEGPDAADAWLITGSRHGAYEDHAWIPPLEALIRAIRDAGKPLVGICFGHQIIAQALGGRVEKFSGGWAVGRRHYSIGGRELALNAWHQDQVVELPEGATVLGENPFTRHAVLAHGDRILTVQPHPEFPASVVEALIEHRSGAVPAPLVEAAREALEAPTDSHLIADWLADVLEGQPATRVPFAERAGA
ncbi:type 1 glutamine amidotransferase [Roseicyclus persicicus]|uniref:Type 1 glutamine amidotransferase n=1 Tax=Roseicyclus persicicus TaxID=2650661 RepID=A0A7X6JX18_9RHOB|nr:type 1 glutamine amidotransferase [Roseibacterium persicicum]NKX44310.1 type 1 glutamine amidotransferase [Roseibacterium persicicum]